MRRADLTLRCVMMYLSPCPGVWKVVPTDGERWLSRPATAKKGGLSLYHIVGKGAVRVSSCIISYQITIVCIYCSMLISRRCPWASMKRGGCKFGGRKSCLLSKKAGCSFAVGTQAQRVSAPPPRDKGPMYLCTYYK